MKKCILFTQKEVLTGLSIIYTMDLTN
jgi:hypothetical protein